MNSVNTERLKKWMLRNVSICINLPALMVERLDQLASQKMTNRSQIIRGLLQDGLLREGHDLVSIIAQRLKDAEDRENKKEDGSEK